MVRLGIFSDLHLELERQRAPVDTFRYSAPNLPASNWIGPSMDMLSGAVDLVLMAGDIDARTRGVAYGHVLAGYLGAPVVYVAGNHEYYGGQLSLTSELQREAEQADGVHFLENGRAEFTISNRAVVVLGATLWTDFELHGKTIRDEAMEAAAELMSDYQVIRADSTHRRLTPADTIALHLQSREWLREQLSQVEKGAIVVVVTHHAPSARSLVPGREHELFSAAYASNLEPLIAEFRPALWVHGHTHWISSYRLHGTRVVSHPFGYPHERIVQAPLLLKL
jgi:Icc-related predicted phosphoesterase